MLKLLIREHIDEVHYVLFALHQKKVKQNQDFFNGITVNNVFLMFC